MSDSLKNHIENKRADFDRYPIDLDLGWEAVEDKLHAEKVVSINTRWYWMAASLALLAVVFVGFSSLRDSGPEINGELAETQFYYQDMIDAKVTMVKNQVSDPELLADIEALDLAFAELSEDLKDDAQNEEVVQAMISNYRLKLKILERILEDLEGESHEENLDI